MRKRKGGTISNMIIGLIVLYLCLSTVHFYLRGLDQASSNISGPASSEFTNSTGISTTSTVSVNSTAQTDNFTLAQLQTLSFANSSKCNGLLGPAYWDVAIRASGNTTAHLIPGTVYSLARS